MVLKGNNATCSALGQLSATSPTTHKHIGLFWYWFPRGWVCVCSRTLWVSAMNSPVRLGVSPIAATPTGFYSQRFWGSISPSWNSGFHGLSCSPVVPFSLSAHKCGTIQSTSCHHFHLVLQPPPCPMSSPSWVPLSVPPTGLNECYFFKSLVVGLPYILIFWQFWLFLFLNLLLSFFLSWKEGKYIYLCFHLGQESS